MARITMRKVQETKLSEVFTLYLASAAARGVKDKTLRTYEQHLGGYTKDTRILPHEFYDIELSDIAYIKLSNLDIWTNVNYRSTIVASGYEIELYQAE